MTRTIPAKMLILPRTTEPHSRRNYRQQPWDDGRIGRPHHQESLDDASQANMQEYGRQGPDSGPVIIAQLNPCYPISSTPREPVTTSPSRHAW